MRCVRIIQMEHMHKLLIEYLDLGSWDRRDFTDAFAEKYKFEIEASQFFSKRRTGDTPSGVSIILENPDDIEHFLTIQLILESCRARREDVRQLVAGLARGEKEIACPRNL